MSGHLVLSLFPGIGLLDMAFEEEGFCVVRGPDLLWGGDVRRFHPPAGRFDGASGGPPCQAHSKLGSLCQLGNGVPAGLAHGNMIPEFERVVNEARPAWFVMENVPEAPLPMVPEYATSSCILNNRWFGADQNRRRRFSFGRDLSAAHGGGAEYAGHPIVPWAFIGADMAALESPTFEPAVLAGHGPALGQRVRGIVGRTWQHGARLQGLPDDWIKRMEEDAPFTVHGLKRVVGNGVPLPLGRAVARAVKRALGLAQERAA